MARQVQGNLVICACLPRPHTKHKSYDELSQWNGKEMKEMSQYLRGVVTQSLQGGSPTQHPKFNCAIECTQALL
jgi:hypothetical protein